MEHPLIVTFPKGQLGPKDKERMTKHGILWLEAESDHKAIQQLAITKPLVQSVVTGDAVVVAALNAMATHAGEQTLRAFVRGLAEAVKTPNVKVSGPEPLLAKVRSTEGLGDAAPSAPTFEQGEKT